MTQNNKKRNDKSNKKEMKAKKHVVFQDDACQIVEVDPPSENDRGNCWYSAREVEAIRASLLQEEEMCRMIMATNSQDSKVATKTKDPSFGIVSHCRLQAQRSFVKAILAQQEEHKMYGIQDARGLYQFSKSLTKDSKRRAVEEARSLAFDCQTETTTTSRELVSCIDNVLDILDIPLPMDTTAKSKRVHG